MIRKNRKYGDLSLVFRDFHFIKDGDVPESITFCFIVLQDGSCSAGTYWSLSEDKKSGRFIRGTADAIPQEQVKAWLSLDAWNTESVLKDGEVNRLLVGSREDFTVTVENFRSVARGEIPQQDQYCLLLLRDGRISGGRWENGGPYLEEPGFFNHAPAASIIDCGEVWVWAALDPDREIEPALPAEPEKPKEQKPEKTFRRLPPKRKFRYGHDVNAYLEKAVAALREHYPWVTAEHLDKHRRYAIEKEGGRFEFIAYYRDGDGGESREILQDYLKDMDADGFISRIVSDNEYCVVNENRIVDSYSVPFCPVELGGGWNLEDYTFRKHATGDYTVSVTAGDRSAGSGRIFGISAKCFVQPTFDAFLDEYAGIVPGGPFGLFKEDLIGDGQLKAFLGYVPRKKHPEVPLVKLDRKRVIGLYEYCCGDKEVPLKTDVRAGEDPDAAAKLQETLKNRIGEVEAFTKKEGGAIPGYWGIMSSGFPEQDFSPWRCYYTCGYYFAAVEADPECDVALPSHDWKETLIPRGYYVSCPVTEETYDMLFKEYVNTVIPEMGYRLDGAVCEFFDAEAGGITLYFPVKKLH